MNPTRSNKIILAAFFVAQHFLAVAQTTNAIAPPDYPKFIAARNIFDPNREPNVPYRPPVKNSHVAPVVRQVESFTLVGIVGYGDGSKAGVYAFFDGTRLDYHKTAQLNDTIANFRITDIAADSVTLMSDTNSLTVLRIGEQLHNDGVGHWLSATGIAARYNSSGSYGNGRNSSRNGSRRRNNNLGSGGNNYGNVGAGNYTRGRNNFVGPASATGNPPGDQNANFQDDNMLPDNMPPPDINVDDNPAVPQTDQPPDSPGPTRLQN
jgi:hypothetical protein